MNKLMLTTLSVAAIFLVSDAFAQARGGGGARGARPEFSSLDTNTDGAITLDEVAVMNTEEAPEGASEFIARMDTDSDGSVSEEEFERWSSWSTWCTRRLIFRCNQYKRRHLPPFSLLL